MKISNWKSNRGNKRFLTGLTVVELLTVVAVIALLVGILLPSLTAVRKSAKEAQQRVQITTIDLALTAFKNDYGDYPLSDWDPIPKPENPRDYCGAQKLCEALLGWDLLGFHPKSAWRADGYDENGGEWTYDPGKVRGDDTLDERKGPYLELATANAFRLGHISFEKPGLYRNYGTFLEPDTFVLCDVFGARVITLANGSTVKAGTPILYYKADTSKKSMNPIDSSAPDYVPGFSNQIYDAYDNLPLMLLGKLTPDGGPGVPHKLRDDDGLLPYDGGGEYFYNKEYKVIDPKVTARTWPYRPDSYILISAGADGFYGTADDITNF